MQPLEGRSLSIFIVTAVFLSISFIAVCLRCFVRLRIVKAFGWDDALMVFAMLLNILFALCGITGALYGIGQRSKVLADRGTMETAMFWWWLGQTSYVWVCAVCKCSITTALLRLTVSRLHRTILWTVVGVTTVVGLIFWFMLTLQCHPVSFFWQRVRLELDPLHANISGSCMSLDSIINIAYVYSVTATCCDFTLGILPIFLVWNLQMNTRTKTALATILGMGCVASAAVIIRIPYLHDYKDDDFLCEYHLHCPRLFPVNEDLTATDRVSSIDATSNISIWSNVEASLGIAAGSLVTLRPLFRWFRDPSSAGTRSKRTGGSVPLSSVNAVRSDPSGPQYWRPDLDPDDSHAVITTIHTSNQGSRTSSQEDLNPKPGHGTFFSGVNVQKTFFVSEHET
ncbi:hypothetical protein N7532_002057 [Penicillium argentinense]|uniref:Rhodopsin domain-containing protein n=1 Tax=Penicillium argentinense TaxID=1131581 RepID=A0A9W9G3U5_9EURO|nr:uncharacterized protein N7532_002057 [Penicillium argentinense]KAJ5111522.1 hypothetical protein N7532_002057 [Penicillium argentinense]